MPIEGALAIKIFSDRGDLPDEFIASPLYFVAKKEQTRSLFRLDADGRLERLLSDVTLWEMRGGRLYYRNSDFALFIATLKKGAVQEIERIDRDITFFHVTPDGSAVFYLKPTGSQGLFVGDLYCAKYQKAPVRLGRSCDMGNLRISADSKRYAFTANCTALEGSFFGTAGDLYVGKMGKAPEKIDEDVYAVLGRYQSAVYFDREFPYLKLLSNKNGLSTCSLLYFDGRKKQLLLPQLLQKIG